MLMTETRTLGTSTDIVAASRRLQPYRFIHKALRAQMCRALQQTATLDAARADDRATLQAVVDELLQVCADHLAHEDRFFHLPLRERAPRAVLPFDDDHRSHEASITALRARLTRLAAGGIHVRAEAYGLHLELTRFIGESLEHMAEEETRLTQALWQHFGDAEIAAQADRLRAALSEQERTYYLRWMARALDDAELAELAAEARGGMPPESFARFVDLLAGELDAARRARLLNTLGQVDA
jgi:hypothetical protein